ncbi:MAG TPA: tRNA preQ1(34) S-adenosylmethionine ribosyltransferase-isomerase QueA [Soehngenia sp.]|nr:tRNA preQ1(34) S-adenosylmethionine ribosyltransferase-isomerase QueA [Soehngenia sp.]HPP32289.1 tRNA preQ1(34) S-adenosylmethionine ribosyltransferase-isomerase QueA [Soehngenia sp.]
MKTADFNYNLPKELIAQVPLEDRTSSRLMIVNRKTEEITNRKFTDIVNELDPGDCLVLNDTKVMPARLFGHRPGKEEKIEVLLLKRISNNTWECLVKPGKKMREDTLIEFGDILKGKVQRISDGGIRVIEFYYRGVFEEVLDELGEMPLPPYITQKLKEKERYQTVYSKNIGSAAAPTAGLHFDNAILNEIENKGVNIAYLTLHVGLGTFRPVKVEKVEEHKMHSEYYEINEECANKINESKSNGGKIVSVGTTSLRTLETVADDNGFVKAQSGWTDIFIYPGYKFKIVDELITNFHLPESTLLMLICAFANKDLIMKAYNKAIEEKYRFFSFGDAMLIK